MLRVSFTLPLSLYLYLRRNHSESCSGTRADPSPLFAQLLALVWSRPTPERSSRHFTSFTFISESLKTAACCIWRRCEESNERKKKRNVTDHNVQEVFHPITSSNLCGFNGHLPALLLKLMTLKFPFSTSICCWDGFCAVL